MRVVKLLKGEGYKEHNYCKAHKNHHKFQMRNQITLQVDRDRDHTKVYDITSINLHRIGLEYRLTSDGNM